jgi:hypothetical protein
MRGCAFLLVTVLAAAPVGCPSVPGESDGPGGAARGVGSLPIMPGDANSGPSGNGSGKPKRYQIVVTLKLTNIEVPVGTASGSEEVWSYLEEEPVRSIDSANLGRNGFRVGLGRAGSWPDLVTVFKRMTGRSPKQSLVATMPGAPLPIILKEKQSTETIFTSHGDRTVTGRDYPPGDYLLAVVCTLDEDDLSKVLITAMPQVRGAKSRKTFAMAEDGPSIVVKSEVYDFAPLVFQLMIPPKGFVVIGPGANSRNPICAGHHFLVRKKEGMEFETLLVLTPEVFATPVRGR